MGYERLPKPALLIAPVFSADPALIETARGALADRWGPVALTSDPFAFDETAYYEAEMGPGLQLTLYAFERLIDPSQLPEMKRASNRLEQELARWRAEHSGRTLAGSTVSSRPVNIDPGYLTEAKFVLATTKDRDHRLYLRDGVFAEITLRYTHGAWRAFEWTYPNYQRADYQAFLSRCREYYRERLRQDSGGASE